MRLNLLILGLLLVGLGCNSDPRCRRETALLRAEILDLEDKYYLTKAQRDEALVALQAQGKGDVATKIDRRSLPERFPQSQEIHFGEAIYDDATWADGELIGTVDHEIMHYDSTDQGDIALDEYQLPARPMAGSPNQFTNPTKPIPNRAVPSGSQFRENSPRDSILVSPETNSNEIPTRGNNGAPAPSHDTSRTNPKRSAALGTATQISSANPVTEIVIDRNQTQVQLDGIGEQGLNLLLRTRNAQGKSLRSSGSITVSIVDPFATSPEQRLGIWKFLPEEVELFFTNDQLEPGILLNLPFEDRLPQGKEIAILVRFQTSDGRALETTLRLQTNPKLNSDPHFKIEQTDQDLVAERDDSFNRGESPTKSRSPSSVGSGPAWRPLR